MMRKLAFIVLLLSSAAATAQQEGTVVYVDITPDFVTNYDEGARLKYLRANVSLKTVSENEEAVRHHLPSVKNRLIILFSDSAEEDLTSTVGRESLRRVALDEVKQTLDSLVRDGALLVDDLYFTNFVVQN